MMKLDMADWATAKDILVKRMDAGAWRHGIKTWDAVKELIRYGKFPADPSSDWPKRIRKKHGDILKFALYYFTQVSLKNVYHVRLGASGRFYRVRRFYCVPHGLVDGELDENGKPRKASKEGLWLRDDDLNPADIQHLVKRYRARETDSAPVKRYIWTAGAQSMGRPADATLADFLGDVLDAL